MAAAEKAEWVWLDGRFVPWAEATIHVATEAVIRAASVFEGVRAYGNADQEELYVFRLSEHLRRLRRSARLMHMAVEYSDEALTAAFRELIRRNGFRDDVHFRPTVYFGEGESGASYLPEEIRTGMFCIAVRRPHTKALTEGVHAGTSTWRRNADDAALMLNGEGKEAEGPAACFMMVRDGRVVTPPVTADILESITRETLIALLRAELGLEVQERDIDRSEVYAAEEAFFCGSGAEVTPVVSLDRYPLGDGAPGPLTRRIQRLYFDV